MEISLIKDYDQSIPQDVMLVASDADYVAACCALTDKGSESPKIIWVRNTTHFNWLKDFTSQVEIDASYIVKTPRLILADKWGVRVPDWLDDNTVTSQKLLSLNIDKTKTGRIDFESALLSHCLGKSFEENGFDVDKLPSILLDLNRTKSKNNFINYPVLAKCLELKIDAWKKNATVNWVKKVLTRLAEDADSLWIDLTLLFLLHNYPQELLEFVVPANRIPLLLEIPVKAIEELPMNTVAIEQAVSQVELYFNDVSSNIESRDDFKTLLENVSGRLKQELDFIIAVLDRKRFEVAGDDIESVRQKFKTCPGVNQPKLSALDRFVKVSRPETIAENQDWDAEQWHQWTIKQYLPYRNWQLSNNINDPEIEKTVQKFSSWYVEEYISIHSDNELSLVHAMNRWDEQIKNDEMSVILIIDCLPFTYWDIFQNIMRKTGFYRHELKPMFAPLPSDTKFSKPHLVSSTWNLKETDYAKLLRQRSVNAWSGKPAFYFQNLKEFSSTEPSNIPSVQMLNFLPSDEILHSDVESMGSMYEEELYRLFSRIADSVKHLFEAWTGNPEKFNVYVLTDHGACRILDEEKRSLDSKVVNKLFENEKHRYGFINKEESDNIPNNLWDIGFKFTRPFVADDSVYFIPRGHHTVKVGSSSHKHVHGGATPEEIIVPTAVFKPFKLVKKELALRFVGLKIDRQSGAASFYIQRLQPVTIEIQNPNDEEIKIINAEVLSPDSEDKQFNKVTVKGKSYETVEVNCYFKNTAKTQNELSVQFIYLIADEEKVCEISTPAEFKSAATGGFSLKNLSKKDKE